MQWHTPLLISGPTSVKLGNIFSFPRAQRQRLPQGSFPNPLLYNVALSNVLPPARIHYVNIVLSVYADDIRVWAAHKKT